MPLYHAGHVLRYILPDGSHVYVWTGENDDLVMRADAFTPAGRVVPLYLKSL